MAQVTITSKRTQTIVRNNIVKAIEEATSCFQMDGKQYIRIKDDDYAGVRKLVITDTWAHFLTSAVIERLMEAVKPFSDKYENVIYSIGVNIYDYDVKNDIYKYEPSLTVMIGISD